MCNLSKVLAFVMLAMLVTLGGCKTKEEEEIYQPADVSYREAMTFLKAKNYKYNCT